MIITMSFVDCCRSLPARSAALGDMSQDLTHPTFPENFKDMHVPKDGVM